MARKSKIERKLYDMFDLRKIHMSLFCLFFYLCRGLDIQNK